MILDRLCESAQYEKLHPRFAVAFAFLREAHNKADGRYELSDGMYAVLSSVTTHTAGEKNMEAHRTYIDIQYLLEGHSACGWARTAEAELTVPYNAEKDAAFYRGNPLQVPVEKGMFYILFPNDAHEPHCTREEPDSYRVVVVKVPVEIGQKE